MIEKEFDMNKSIRRRIGKTKGKPFTREYLTKKERWGEITITHITPTKPDMEVPPRVPEQVKKRKRKPLEPLPVAFPELQEWSQLSPARKLRLETTAEAEALREKMLHNLD